MKKLSTWFSSNFVAQTFLSAVSPTFLSAAHPQGNGHPFRLGSQQVGKPAIQQTGMSAIRYAAALILFVSIPTSRADSIFSAEFTRSIVADKKATSVGDIITIIVQESNTTTKDSKTETSKASDISAKIQSFFFTPNASTLLTKKNKTTGKRELPALEMSSENKFDGGGKINNSESIIARFGVRVVDVLPNENLIVEGVRQTSFSGESQTVVLRGTVRTFDINPNNTVFSYQLADVSIKFENSGAVSNSQRKGWFTKAWDVLAPF